jgi:hypothetical protein
VQELWIIAPESKTIEVFLLQENATAQGSFMTLGRVSPRCFSQVWSSTRVGSSLVRLGQGGRFWGAHAPRVLFSAPRRKHQD